MLLTGLRLLFICMIDIVGLVISPAQIHQAPLPIPTGQLIDSLVCLEDSQQSYAVYLPSYYSPDKKWPVIYAFDPIARGKLPVSLLEQTAETYGYLVFGSNNSRNGPWERCLAAINAMGTDTDSRFSIDPDRIYATGFSGGSRVASQLSVLTGNIRGVIGCGAGFPRGISPHSGLSFSYVALIGTQDMNYLEMQELVQELTQANMPHLMLTFDGGHSWPPSETLHAAVRWLETEAMRAALIPKRTALIQEIKTLHYTQLQSTDTTDSFEAYTLYQSLINHLEGLTDVSRFQQKVEALVGSASVRNAFSLQQKTAQQEADYLKVYEEAFLRISLSPVNGDSTMESDFWWKKEIKQLQKLLADETNPHAQLLAARMIDCLWRNAFVQYRDNFQFGKYGLAKKYARTWSLIQADQPSPYYAWAKCEAALSNEKRALKLLEQAIENGFSNRAYLDADETFVTVRQLKKYAEVVSKVPDDD